ncbi:prosaposin [Pelodytes ibericus]
MKWFIALSCVLLTVSASPLFGTEQCASGPVVWCENVQTASQCGAVKHCQETIWNKPVVKSVPCDLCKQVVTIVENFVKDNSSQSEIEAYLNKFCDLLPDAGMAATCKQLVAEYFPIILNILEQELDNPSVVCCALGLCKNLQQFLGSLKPPQQLQTNEIPEVGDHKMAFPFLANVPLLLYPQDKTTAQPKNGDICQDCLMTLNDMQDQLRGNSSFSKKLKDQAVQDCQKFGGGSADMCQGYIDQYFDVVIQMLLQMNQKPDQMCCLIGFCDSKAVPVQVAPPAEKLIPAAKLQPAIKISKKPTVEGSPTCEVCQLLMTEVESLLEDNRTLANIEKVLEKVCSVLPKKYADQCKDVVDTYSKAIIELLEQEVSPKDICQALGLCSSQRLQKIVKLDPVKVKSGGCCQLCKLVVNYMDNLLEKNITEERIKNKLKMVCNYLPDSYQEECRAMVTEYEPMLVQLLLQALDPSFVCMKLRMCESTKLPILGADKCMWGPSYWCKDMNTAADCNAIEHCKRHIWN